MRNDGRTQSGQIRSQSSGSGWLSRYCQAVHAAVWPTDIWYSDHSPDAALYYHPAARAGEPPRRNPDAGDSEVGAGGIRFRGRYTTPPPNGGTTGSGTDQAGKKGVTLMQAQANITRLLIYFSIASNMVLGAVIFTRLAVTPADVLHEVNNNFMELRAAADDSKRNIDELRGIVDQRGEWMRSVDTELANRTRDRLYRSEFKQWCEVVRMRHPELSLPDLDDETPIER